MDSKMITVLGYQSDIGMLTSSLCQIVIGIDRDKDAYRGLNNDTLGVKLA